MARDIYFQAVGNPIQPERLPAHRPELALPFQPYKPKQDTQFALKLLVIFMCLAAAAMFTHFLSASGKYFADLPFLFWMVALFLAAAGRLLERAIRDRRRTYIALPVGCLGGACLYLYVSVSLPLHLLLSAATIGALTWLVGTHWTALCTASPLSREIAAQLQTRWNGYLLVMAFVPPAIALVHLLSGSWELSALAMAMITIFHFCQARFVASHRGACSVLGEAAVSWLAYNRDDTDMPGVFQSPAGAWRYRVVVTGASVFLGALTYIRYLTEDPSNPIADLIRHRLANSPFASPEPLLYAILLWLGALAATLVLPTLLVIFVPLILTLPVLVEALQYRTSSVRAEDWPTVVAEVRTSVDPIERNSLYLGRVAHDGSPLLVPRDLFREHAHFLGDTGTGKTSMGLAPLIEQLVATGECSVVMLDLKADSMELFAMLLAAAQERERRTGHRMPIKHFSNQDGRSSFAFNPLLQPYWKTLRPYMRTDILCGACGLAYGADYGPGYYSSCNAAVLHHTIKTFPDVVNFRGLAERVGHVVANAKKKDLHPEVRKAGVHVQTVLDRLGTLEPLNVTSQSGHPDQVLREAIDMTRVFTEPQLQYFHLSSTLGPSSSPEIARLVTYSLLAAATQTERKHPVFLVIDEFQRMVARNIEYILQLARSMGVGVVLANQSMQDLRTSTANLIPAIETNCRYRQWFAVSAAEDRQRLIDSSGETVDLLVSQSYTTNLAARTHTISYQERIAPRLTVNDILLASDHPRQSIVRIARGAGYAQYGGMPFVLESNYHITADEYERRKALPWPDATPGSFVPTTPTSNDTEATPSKSAGPVMTTEVIGGPPASPGAQVQQLFESYLREKAPEQEPSDSKPHGRNSP